MAARDRYTWDLKCPKCKRAGIAKVSEDAYPHMRSLRFAVDEVSEGFRVQYLGKSAVDTVIFCNKCNIATEE
jgi:hypothetical protein